MTINNIYIIPMMSSDGTDESSEWQVCLSGSLLLTSSLQFALKLVMSTLVGMA